MHLYTKGQSAISLCHTGLGMRADWVQILPPLPNKKGSLQGPFFVWLCGDQEGNLVQQNAQAFWAPEGAPKG